jgi:ectoine hydroxylase-related dioxygenase (phytanoyl-CoA dioxygenase family)
MVDSSALRAEPRELRARFARDGYLLLRGVLDPALVLGLRGEYFAACETDYLRHGSDPAAGIFSGSGRSHPGAHGIEGHPAYTVVRGRRWSEFVAEPALTGLAREVVGGPVRLLPRQILRQFDRSTGRASRAHVDHSYLDNGSGDVVTFWVPLGDCSVDMGALLYLEGSCSMTPDELDGLRAVSDRPDDPRPLSHDLGWVADRSERRWLWADFRAGDLAVHSSTIVHATLDVRSDVMRLSADLRFQGSDGVPDPRWLQPWAGNDGN